MKGKPRAVKRSGRNSGYFAPCHHGRCALHSPLPWPGQTLSVENLHRAQKDAQEWLNERKQEVRLVLWVGPREQGITVAALLEGFKNQAANKRTRQVRKFCADNLGGLAGTPLPRLRPVDVRAWVGVFKPGRPRAERAALSASSTRQALATLKAALKSAALDRIITSTA